MQAIKALRKISYWASVGNLNVLAPALIEKGHRIIETPYRFKGDVTNYEHVLKTVQQSDAIVHAAALHGIHKSKYTADDFWKLNVTGTFNVYQAAKECGVKKVLLCSTMGVYGESVKVPEDSFSVITEDLPLLPRDIYGQSKKLCEVMAEFYSRTEGIQTIAFRLGMFVPGNFIRYGFRLLKGGVDDRDVAQAFLLGIENTTITFDAFNIKEGHEEHYPYADLPWWGC